MHSFLLNFQLLTKQNLYEILHKHIYTVIFYFGKVFLN